MGTVPNNISLKYIAIKTGAIVIASFMAFNGFSQTEPTAVEKIMEESEGMIVIDIPETIKEGILQTQTGKPGKNDLKSGVNKLAGFRIQVFSDGRNQSTLESRAKARGNVILSKFPKYKGQVYTFSSSPNWYTRIGNFRTQSEANSALTELKKAFPGFASEMRVVKSQIIVVQ